jgi:hypothetical protein
MGRQHIHAISTQLRDSVKGLPGIQGITQLARVGPVAAWFMAVGFSDVPLAFLLVGLTLRLRVGALHGALVSNRTVVRWTGVLCASVLWSMRK